MENFLNENWWSIVLVICVAAFYGLKYVAHSTAKAEALKYLAAASKLAFATGDAKVIFVTQVAFAALPKYIKAFIPSSVFSLIVSSVYDELKDLVKELHDDALDKVNPPVLPQPEQSKPEQQAAQAQPDKQAK